MVSSAQPGSHGDGIQLARPLGAKISHLERVQGHPNIAAGTSIMLTLAFRTNGGILVNKEGKRFFNDNAPRNELGAAMLRQPAQKVWLIYDDAVAAKRQKVHNGYVRLGFVSEGQTPEEVAKKVGLPEKAFADQMQKYAGFVKNGKDLDFGRKELPEALNKGKIYAIEVIPAIGVLWEVSTSTRRMRFWIKMQNTSRIFMLLVKWLESGTVKIVTAEMQ